MPCSTNAELGNIMQTGMHPNPRITTILWLSSMAEVLAYFRLYINWHRKLLHIELMTDEDPKQIETKGQ
jgi:hypothetical protein